MLIVKGTAVEIDLEKGRTLRPPRAHGMMHDPDGGAWPSCSILIGPFTRGTRETRPTRDARSYFGDGYIAKQGHVTLPSRELSRWRKVGAATDIRYRRPGTFAPGGFYHPFKRSLFKREHPGVYSSGEFLRVELPWGCTVNKYGLVWP